MGRYRYIAVERALAVWPVLVMCRVLDLSKSAFSCWLERPTRGGPEDRLLRVHVRAIHRRSRETCGSPGIHAELREEGFCVSRKRVARLMREEGIAGLPAKRKFQVATTDSDHDDPMANNVPQRNFEAERPNTAWVGDNTYLRTATGFVYLAILIDLYSRRVVGWAVRDQKRTSLVQEALQRAVALGNPPPSLVHHTDRGSQYTSADYRANLDRIAAVPSMGRKGDWWDNAVAVSIFGTLERELAGREPNRADVGAADAAVVDYMVGFYNLVRRHRTLGQVSPVEFEAQRVEAQLAVAAPRSRCKPPFGTVVAMPSGNTTSTSRQGTRRLPGPSQLGCPSRRGKVIGYGLDLIAAEGDPTTREDEEAGDTAGGTPGSWDWVEATTLVVAHDGNSAVFCPMEGDGPNTCAWRMSWPL